MYLRNGRYKTVIVSISMPLDMLQKIEDIAIKKNSKRSETVQWLIRLAFAYLKLLKEQEKGDENNENR